MSKIDEFIDSIWDYDGYSTPDIRRIMKEYAEIYAKLIIQEIQNEYGSHLGDDLTQIITLPPHE